MILIQLISGILCGVGLFYVLADALKIPTYAASKAANNLGKRQHPKTNPLEIWLRDLSHFIAGKLRLNEYRRAQLEADLAAAEIKLTPEEYMANALTKALFISVFAVPIFFISRLGVLLVLVFAFVTYYRESKSVTGKLKDRRQKIEYELPRLVSNIEKTLKHSRDVVYMLDSYKDNSGPELRRELEITLADMRSGNMEIALTRLESRVGSAMMSDVTRGLIGIIRGDDTVVYWATLAIKLGDYQRQLLKAQAKAVPRKVKKLSVVLLVCFMLMYIAVIGQVLLSSLTVMF